ncbi:MAG TPA: carboxylesterase family protein [Polyangiaceae bacterium]
MKRATTRILCSAAVLIGALGCGVGPGDPSGSGGASSGGSGGASCGTPGGSAGNPWAGGAGNVQVRTTFGTIAGTSANAMLAFKGIPYAAPPVGPKRFRPPQPHPGWSGVRNTTAYGSICPQYGHPGAIEDCLTLNLWALAGASAPRPVMVFIYGGGFEAGGTGGGFDSAYDGAALAHATGHIVVNFNYRVGVLGFLAAPELIAESPEQTAGNYGILDQIAALRWVRDNISAFGGDPSRVFVFGQSAGGASICSLLGSPRARGLFHAAAIQSGPCSLFPHLNEVTSAGPAARDEGSAFLQKVGCTGPGALECLRCLPTSTIIQTQGNLPKLDGTALPAPGLFANAASLPNVDGKVIPADPIESVTNARVPVIIGINSDEGSGLADLMRPALGILNNPVTYHWYLGQRFGTEKADGIVALYPASAFPSAADALAEFGQDLLIGCPSEAIAARASAAGIRAHLYIASRGANGSKALHGAELPYLFDKIAAPDAIDVQLRDIMQGAWGGFAANPGVSPPSQPAWPAFTKERRESLRMGNSVEVATTWQSGRCAGLRALGLTPPAP